MISIDKLKSYAEKLEFTMKEEEYITLQKEFEILLEQVEKIDGIESLNEYSPISFPFPLETSYLRSDEVDMALSKEEALMNAKETYNDMVKVPKVVE